MLMDKGYYDYDYEAPTEKEIAVRTAAKSDAELEERLKKMGFSIKPKSAKNKPMSAEQLQLEVMEEEKKKQAARHGKSV